MDTSLLQFLMNKVRAVVGRVMNGLSDVECDHKNGCIPGEASLGCGSVGRWFTPIVSRMAVPADRCFTLHQGQRGRRWWSGRRGPWPSCRRTACGSRTGSWGRSRRAPASWTRRCGWRRRGQWVECRWTGVPMTPQWNLIVLRPPSRAMIEAEARRPTSGAKFAC